jgi:5-dehydro-4-deoxyglucarate dehydratase
VCRDRTPIIDGTGYGTRIAIVVGDLLQRFFLPLVALRNRKPGYAVSMIKAGVRLVGRDAGPVRAPLTELDDQEVEVLRQLVSAVGGV